MLIDQIITDYDRIWNEQDDVDLCYSELTNQNYITTVPTWFEQKRNKCKQMTRTLNDKKQEFNEAIEFLAEVVRPDTRKIYLVSLMTIDEREEIWHWIRTVYYRYPFAMN